MPDTNRKLNSDWSHHYVLYGFWLVRWGGTVGGGIWKV